jgi:hypothetical protein
MPLLLSSPVLLLTPSASHSVHSHQELKPPQDVVEKIQESEDKTVSASVFF